MKQAVEILAPAGSPESLVAALEGGADAVYCGLKDFNARGNAVNFSVADLAFYVPLAHQHGTKVYLTLNTLVKMSEMSPILHALAEASDCGIDGVILQDIGLGRTIAKHFPHLRRHASTQLAIHNLEGVGFCVDEGFQRVVLARELTFDEIAAIRAKYPADQIELEVFCHGAMCYTYSGMCFFSGSVGGRSGNRGECAYTCRKGYRIHNETEFPMAAEKGSFKNYLFSMKDMNTLDVLPQLLDTGIDSLKIEGRRKGPAYVHASVRAYRERMETAATAARERDLQLAFGRDYTAAFYQRGQFGDHPIDLTATGSKGLPLGTIEADGCSFVLEQDGLQRYDGLRLVTPQRDETLLSFNKYTVEDGDRMRPAKGARVTLAKNFPPGTHVMWVNSQAVNQQYRPASRFLGKRVAELPLLVHMAVEFDETTRDLNVRAYGRHGSVSRTLTVPSGDQKRALPLRDKLFRFGDTAFQAGEYHGPAEIDGFLPFSQLKKLRRDLLGELNETLKSGRSDWLDALIKLEQPEQQTTSAETTTQFALRVADLATLEHALKHQTETDQIDFVMRPTLSTPDWRKALDMLRGQTKPVRFALPMVLRKWDLRVIRHRLPNLADFDCEFVLANPAHFDLLAGDPRRKHADFSLYHLNRWAVEALEQRGIDGRFTLSLEDDKPNMEALLRASDAGRFEVIGYTDTPLFVAEACSLAALYGGCPGAKKCGHETLFIENEHGDQFQVRHDRCRSTVIGEQALSWSGQFAWFRRLGVATFRLDFTTRPYSADQMGRILEHARRDQVLADTHTENLDRILL
ncbi:peptidase U32 family protein [Acanthopleuribacter pedis]|uniref:U32 family peptidase n=1 Tax=Acanthopleuribacter pedis TaxID=442870 RepID=A0A8J7Q5W4_9BACT|nr:U32 family peptidase [Acanthopleuribacter pedis]MBO1318717.1 U32 family peptidase [Acanthopleuribacter pedis]